MKSVKIFSPATVANVNVGFDVLGYALDSLGDYLTVEVIDEINVIIDNGKYRGVLPDDPEKNTAGLPLLKLIEDKKLEHGFRVTIDKMIPIGSGLGGSASCAVGAVFGANCLMDQRLKLSKADICTYALIGETLASGSLHGDNVIPCLYGGLNLIRNLSPLERVKIMVPSEIVSYSFSPLIEVSTAEARKKMSSVPIEILSKQVAEIGTFVMSLYEKNYNLLKTSFHDFIVEEQRSKNIPGFLKYKELAVELGALGFGISGSGPAMFAWFLKSEINLNEKINILKKLMEDSLGEVFVYPSEISTEGVRSL